MKKGQVVYIHGGSIIRSKEELYQELREKKYSPHTKRHHWCDSVSESLENDFDFFRLQMPNKGWYDYTAWSIWFEKTFEYLTGETFVLIGESVGGLFVTKYLSENKLPKQVDQLHLIAPVFDRYEKLLEPMDPALAHDIEKLPQVNEVTKEIYLYHSTDDLQVSTEEGKKYLQYFPSAHYQEFTDRGHFFVPEFPELVANIKKLV